MGGTIWGRLRADGGVRWGGRGAQIRPLFVCYERVISEMDVGGFLGGEVGRNTWCGGS